MVLLLIAGSTYAQDVVASRDIDLGGELCDKCDIFLRIDGTVEGTNKPKFVVRLAAGNNIYDHTLNDAKQSTYIFSNDVEADKHRKRIKNMVANPNKSDLLSVDEEGIKQWSYINTKLERSFPEKLNVFTFATSRYKVAYNAFKPNGDIVNKLYDYVNKKASSFKVAGTPGDGMYSKLQMSADGKYLLGFVNTAGMNMLGEFAVWDVLTGKVIFKNNSRVRDAKFTPDSKHIFYVSEVNKLYKYSVEGKFLFDTPVGSTVFKITVSEDSKYVYAKEFDGFTRIDAETGKVDKKIAYKFPIHDKHCIFTEDGRYALITQQAYDKKNELKASVVELFW